MALNNILSGPCEPIILDDGELSFAVSPYLLELPLVEEPLEKDALMKTLGELKAEIYRFPFSVGENRWAANWLRLEQKTKCMRLMHVIHVRALGVWA